MPRRNIEGGKIKKPKSLKQIGKDINRGLKKAEDFGQNLGTQLGQVTNKQILPALVSAGIPLASTALGVAGQEFGIPPELTSSLSKNLMKGYIPKQYQSNKYASMFGDVLSSGLTGDSQGAMEGMMEGLPQSRGKYSYNPDQPFQDLLLQQLDKYAMDNLPSKYTDQYNQLQDEARQIQSTQENMAHGKYEQREGSADALIGAGIKKRRGRKPKVITEEIEIYTKKKPSYKKFSHAKNTALDQLLEATAEREEKEASKAMRQMIDQQSRMLTALGYKPKKNF